MNRKHFSTVSNLAIVVFCAFTLLIAQDKPAQDKPHGEPAGPPAVAQDARIQILTLAVQKHLLNEKLQQIQIAALQHNLQANEEFNAARQSLFGIQTQIDAAAAALPYDRAKFVLDQDTATLKETQQQNGKAGAPEPKK